MLWLWSDRLTPPSDPPGRYEARVKRELADGIFIGDLRVVVHWNRWDVGMSVFIPCTDIKDLTRQMRRRARRFGYKLTVQEEVAGGLLGLRFWRSL